MSTRIVTDSISPRQAAAALTGSIALILALGIAAALVIGLAALWLAAQFVFLALQSITEVSQAIGTTYQTADPLVRFLLLVALGYVAYRAGKWLIRR